MEWVTPPKTNRAPQKGAIFWRERIVFQPAFFTGHVSFFGDYRQAAMWFGLKPIPRTSGWKMRKEWVGGRASVGCGRLVGSMVPWRKVSFWSWAFFSHLWGWIGWKQIHKIYRPWKSNHHFWQVGVWSAIFQKNNQTYISSKRNPPYFNDFLGFPNSDGFFRL